MEPAGLALEEIGVTVLFEACIRVFNGLVKAEGLGDESHPLRKKLSVQRTRLLTWGENLGFVAGPDGSKFQYDDLQLDREDVKSAAEKALHLLYLKLQDSKLVTERDADSVPGNHAWTKERLDARAKVWDSIDAVTKVLDSLEWIADNPRGIKKTIDHLLQLTRPKGNITDTDRQSLSTISEASWELEPSAFRGLDSDAIDGADLGNASGSDGDSREATTDGHNASKEPDIFDTAAIWGSASESGSDSPTAATDDNERDASKEDHVSDKEDLLLTRPPGWLVLDRQQTTDIYRPRNVLAEDDKGQLLPDSQPELRFKCLDDRHLSHYMTREEARHSSCKFVLEIESVGPDIIAAETIPRRLRRHLPNAMNMVDTSVRGAKRPQTSQAQEILKDATSRESSTPSVACMNFEEAELDELAGDIVRSGDTTRIVSMLLTDATPDTMASTVPATFSSGYVPSTKPSSVAESLPLDHQQADECNASYQDDIKSLPSVDGDLASSVNTGPVTRSQRAAAVSYLVKMLNKDDEISALYEVAFRKMDGERFRRNHNKLMLSFVTELSSEKSLSASQDVTVRFLQRRTTCDQLSSKIFGSINPNGKTDRERINHLASQDKDLLFSLNRYLEAVDVEHAKESLVIQPVDQDLSDVGSDDEGEIELDDEDMFADILPRLQETWTSLFSGSAFDRYKDNLRRFLHPEMEIEHQTPLGTLGQDQYEDQQTPETPEYQYEISLARPLWNIATDLCQRQLETLACTQFCWWPLPQPEKNLKSGYVRVYSRVFEKGLEFYDDIPRSLAVSLFPRLVDSLASSSKCQWTSRDTPAVYLKHTTLMDHLGSRTNQSGESSSSQGPPSPAAQKRKGKGKARSSNALGSQHPPSGCGNQRARPEVTGSEQNRQSEKNKNRVLFLTGDIAANEAVALTFEVGPNDESTMQNLLAAYRRLPSWRWKFATGFKFYRFRSFRNEAAHNFRRITPDKDTERYPEKTHVEYPYYRYMPAPWEEEDDIPCPSGELWLHFKDPKACGTSSAMTDALPVRNGDLAHPRFTAWGIHIERRTHVMVVMIPVWIAFLATVAPTAWFIHSWLVDHPGDLQSATVPMFLGINLVGFVIQTVLAFVFYGWTRDP